MRNAVMCQRNLGLQNAVCHRNFRDVRRNTIICHRNIGIQNAVWPKNLERCNAKYGNVSGI
jgi:hypothetical protein